MHEGKRQLIGVGRLIADPDHESAEYAVLITDNWQRKELGVILTEYCLEIAKNWGLKQFLAQTTKDNHAMISVFKKMEFKIKFNADSTVDVSRDLI